MGSMMTLLSLYLSTHVPLCLRVSPNLPPLPFPSFSPCYEVRMWLRNSNGCLLNLTSGCNLCSLIQYCANSLPSQCWPNTTQHGPFTSNVTHFHSLYSTQQVYQQVSFCFTDCIQNLPSCCTHTYDRPLNKAHTLILIPQLLQAQCEWWDCAMMEINEPSLQPWYDQAAPERDEKMRLLVSFPSSLIYLVQGSLMHKGHKRTIYTLWMYNKYVHLYSLYSYVHTCTNMREICAFILLLNARSRLYSASNKTVSKRLYNKHLHRNPLSGSIREKLLPAHGSHT